MTITILTTTTSGSSDMPGNISLLRTMFIGRYSRKVVWDILVDNFQMDIYINSVILTRKILTLLSEEQEQHKISSEGERDTDDQPIHKNCPGFVWNNAFSKITLE